MKRIYNFSAGPYENSGWLWGFVFAGRNFSSVFYDSDEFYAEQKADYILTGYWAKKAYEEAKKYGQINVAASSGGDNFFIFSIAPI